MTRTEFGVERASCSCRHCRRNCMFLPGYLIPADFERLIPAGADPLAWAEINLLASPGATVIQNGNIFRVPTLVPAKKANGSCVHYQKRGCAIWENAPFGCAFFGCGAKDEDRIAKEGLKQTLLALRDPDSLYTRIWQHLWGMGKQQEAPEIIRKRMKETE